ncbi:unnamed protein product [Camellia sinensis]
MGHEKKLTVREVKGLVADDGWKCLYRGLSPSFFTMSAWGTSMILSYEYLNEIAKTFVDLIIVNYWIGKFKPNACLTEISYVKEDSFARHLQECL